MENIKNINTNNFHEYLKKYDDLEKIIVYNFLLGDGGIGDNIKFFMFLLKYCVENNIKLCYLVNNIYIEKYLQLKYEKMYITNNVLTNKIIINNYNDIFNIKKDKYYLIRPYICYKISDEELYNNIFIPVNEVFKFSDIIKENSITIFPTIFTTYISIHLRLGDKFLEVDKKFIMCKGDTRDFNEEKLYEFIENHKNHNILFFCDNLTYKLKIKNKYNHVFITTCDIGHTSLTNTTDKQTLDAITEFYIMSNSNEIYTASKSGFSILSSKFNNIPLQKI